MPQLGAFQVSSGRVPPLRCRHKGTYFSRTAHEGTAVRATLAWRSAAFVAAFSLSDAPGMLVPIVISV
jgi:hypothetical protein